MPLQLRADHVEGLGRVAVASAVAWLVISACLTLFVVQNYPSSAGWSTVAQRQLSNWMPFAVFYPSVRFFHVRVGAARRRSSTRFAMWTGLGLVLTMLYLVLREVSLAALRASSASDVSRPLDGAGRMWPIAVLVYFVVVGWAIGAESRELRLRVEQEKGDLEVQLAGARLEALESQVRPHFLFNTLQAVEDACWEHPALASKMLLDLSDILRASLDRAKGYQVTTLRTELELARKYISIQKVRFGERLNFRETLDERVFEQPLPCLFLQPLIENAVVHGIERLPEGGTIDLRVGASQGRARIEIVNDSAGPESMECSTGFGLGLKNSRERLQALYGADATVELSVEDTGRASVRTEMTLWSSV